MGLFNNRKNSKVSIADERSIRSGTSVDRASIANSIKSPRLNGGSNYTDMPMPDIPIPKAPDPTLDPATYLRSIYAVRQRSALVMRRAKANKLNHFDVDLSKFKDTAGYVVSIIKVPFPCSL